LAAKRSKYANLNVVSGKKIKNASKEAVFKGRQDVLLTFHV
jgi:hypothetical protein